MSLFKNKYFSFIAAIIFYILVMFFLNEYLLLPLAKAIFKFDFYQAMIEFFAKPFSSLYLDYNVYIGILNAWLQTTTYFILFGGLIALLYNSLKYDYTDYKEREVYCNKYLGYSLIMYFIVNYATNIIVMVLKFLLKSDVTSENQNQIELVMNSSYESAILMIISVVILGPLVEELIFRKSFFKLIPNKIAALIISSLVFGFLHTFSFNYSITDLFIVTLPYAMSGVAFGYCYYKTENILPCYILHAGLNLFSVIMIFMM